MEQSREPGNKLIVGQLIFAKEARIFNRERMVSSINGAGENWKIAGKKMKLGPYFIPFIKINFNQ